VHNSCQVKSKVLDKLFQGEYKQYMAGRPKKEQTEILYVRVPRKIDKRLRDDAKREGRELSGQIRIILERYYEQA
jgi:hypothetical protein